MLAFHLSALGAMAAPFQTPFSPSLSQAGGSEGSQQQREQGGPPELPSEIKGKTVEEIIRNWNNELERRTQDFAKHAKSISEWDKHIMENRKTLASLTSDVSRVQRSQEALERQLNLLESHQDEIKESLESMEGETERMYEEMKGSMDAHTQRRDEMYAKAQDINQKLNSMGKIIRQLISRVNNQQYANGGDAGQQDPLNAAVRVLNNQLASLQWVESQCADISSRLDQLGCS